MVRSSALQAEVKSSILLRCTKYKVKRNMKREIEIDGIPEGFEIKRLALLNFDPKVFCRNVKIEVLIEFEKSSELGKRGLLFK